MLAGFTAAGLDGSAGHGGTLQFVLYAASVALIFLTALLVWLGLSYGKWIAILAVVPFGIAVLLEVSAHRS